jgi:drug/metabolite transporter (DMT)-like permease
MPVLFLILACLLWGLSFPLIKALHLEQSVRLPEMPSWLLAAWLQVARFGMAALLLIPLMIRRGLPTRMELRQGLLVGIWGGLGMAIMTDSLAYTHASTSAFLTQAYCIILPLWVALRTRKAPEGRVIAATLLVLLGTVILSGMRWNDFRIGRGEAGTLVAALFFALQILALEDPRFSINRGVPVTFIMCLAITLAFLPVTLAGATDHSILWKAGASPAVLLLVMSLALFCSVGAFVLMNIWQRRVSATEAGLIYTTEPVFAAVYVLFLPSYLGRLTGVPYENESLTISLVFGGALIVAANGLMQWRRRPHRPAIAPVP